MAAKPVHKPIEDAATWWGEDFTNDGQWIVRLTGEEQAELVTATRGVQDQGKGVSEFTLEEFQTPRVAGKLAQIHQELVNGRGFVLLRGLPIEDDDDPIIRTLFWSIGLHLGEPVSQEVGGDPIVAVTNTGLDYNDLNVRGYKTRDVLAWHNDAAGLLHGIDGRAPEIVALLCVRPAQSGGVSRIASAAAMYN